MRKNYILAYIIVIFVFLFTLFFGNKAISVIAQQIPSPRKHCIILDAGHGGEDGGAISYTGISESVINLEITYRLRDFLHFLGFQTKMVRTSNVSVYTSGNTLAQKKISDLKERVRIVNEAKNGLLLSIHQNYYTERKYKGAQVFYSNTEYSKALAAHLQNTLINTINPGSKRQPKRGEGIYLLDKIQCPGILIECGFLSNPEEEAQLRNYDYQKDIACIIACSLSSFLSNT